METDNQFDWIKECNRLEEINKGLLKACKELVRVWEGPRERAAMQFAGAIIIARQAIAKADGRDEE